MVFLLFLLLRAWLFFWWRHWAVMCLLVVCALFSGRVEGFLWWYIRNWFIVGVVPHNSYSSLLFKHSQQHLLATSLCFKDVSTTGRISRLDHHCWWSDEYPLQNSIRFHQFIDGMVGEIPILSLPRIKVRGNLVIVERLLTPLLGRIESPSAFLSVGFYPRDGVR